MKRSYKKKIVARSRAFCASVTAMSLLSTSALTPAMAADAASLLSSANLSQGAAARAGSGAINPALVTNSPAIQAQLALSSANLARAALALSNMNAAQAAASANSQLTLDNANLSGSSWNGSPLSGLNPLDTDPRLWINAGHLQKDASAATATVHQTSANAILTWQSFDLNKGETLIFDQQGHSDWTVLNRIVAGPADASGSRFVASPSMILGSIQAPGSIYIINPNGIIFGPTAKVNVHSLIASSLDVGNPLMTEAERNSFFLNTGILGNGSTVPAESFSYNPDDKVVEGDIRVDAGATITASLAPRSVSPDAGGFVYLFAPNVENHGTISTPAGETLMVAAQAVQLIANAYPDGFPADQRASASTTFRAVGVNTVLTGGTKLANGPTVTDTPIIWRTDGPASAQISAPGSIVNTGLIDAERGVIILNADNITNGSSQPDSGIIRANTSITRNGEIFLDARLNLNLQNGIVETLPDENGETIPQSALANFRPGSIDLRGTFVDIESGALVLGPGADVSVAKPDFTFGIYPIGIATPPPTRIYMADGAIIDVSGLQDVTLPMSANLLTFKPFGNEFADQPLQRQGALRGQELTVDLRQTGTYNGTQWVGTPLANLSGYLGSVQTSIDQLLTTGGKVSLSSPLGADGQIVLRQGSAINVGGGYVSYRGGSVATSKLITADGRIVDISRADPLDTYVGVASASTLDHPHWGSSTTETFTNPLFQGSDYQPGYIEGHDAGGISMDAAAYVLDGTFYAGTIAGDLQRAGGQRPSASTANSIASNRNAMPSSGYLSFGSRNNLILSADVDALNGSFSAQDALPQDRIDNTRVAASVLTDGNFGSISVSFAGALELQNGADLEVVPGGSISLSGGSVDIEGTVVAHSGSISVESTGHAAGDLPGSQITSYKPTEIARPDIFDLIVGSSALLDASGLWINDSGKDPSGIAGGAFIDGGSVSLKTDTQTAACVTAVCKSVPGLGADTPAIVDLTGDIVLSHGTHIDVSSGGRVTDRGLIQLDSKGRAAGRGGSVALLTYVGSFHNESSPQPPAVSPLSASIVLAGSDGSPQGNAATLASLISAYGFSQGGTLSLQATSINVGGTSPNDSAGLVLPASFFNGNAFGGYSLSAVSAGLTIAPGAQIHLSQNNYLPDTAMLAAPTGSKPSHFAQIGQLPDFIRAPVNLTLFSTPAPLPETPYDAGIPSPPSAVILSIGEGSQIVGDAGAAISVNVTGRAAWQGAISGFGGFKPPIAAQTGVAEILGTIYAPAGSIALTGAVNSEIWLGAASRLDASGVALVDDRQTLFRTGTVLSGGRVSITASDIAGAIVGLDGATIDVSGASGEFDLPVDAPAGIDGRQYQAAQLWSDAGSITLTTPTLLFDGEYVAQPGASEGRGGTLTIVSPEVNGSGNEKITVRQDGSAVSDGLTPVTALDAYAGTSVLLANRLAGSGIDNLILSMGPVQGDTISTSQGKFAPGTVEFSGNVTLSGLQSLLIDASRLSLVNVVAPTDPNGCNVCLSASYVALRGAGNVNKVLPVAGTGALRVAADTIDIAAGGFNRPGSSNALSLSGVAQATFVSSGDIRLRVPLANVPVDLAPGTLPAGELIAAGNLTFVAQQIYPISSVDFTIKSISSGGTVTFANNGVAAFAPLTAGGQVSVSAAHIVQNGTLLAPLGTIRLGAQSVSDLSPNDPTPDRIVPTQDVTFGSGSVTSVSLNGQTVPFGQTANGSSWSYDSLTGQPLPAPPAKNLMVSAAAIDLQSGSKLDLSGGGDIQAIEFVPGTGGTKDVLAGNPNVFAIIPGYNPAAAPIDLDFVVQLGDPVTAAGRTVYLSGQQGLPAGYYTLLPAHYATLPGAYRVALVSGTQDALTSQNAVLPDGTLRVAGYFADKNGARDAHTQYFDVQSSAVWRQYTEIDQSSGDSFFGNKVQSGSGLPPLLALDAGHAVFSAVNAINLEGLISSAPGKGGRGSEFDIAAQDIEVVSSGDQAQSGYIALDADQLSNLGVDSLLLGGVRSTNADGERISVIANSIQVSNDEDSALEGPEIIFVTKIASGATDPNAKLGLVLNAGSVVRAKGNVVSQTQKRVTIGDDTLKIVGNGSLLAVSNGSTLIVNREHVVQPNGIVTLAGTDPVAGPGALIQGASVTLDTSGSVRPGDGATIDADNISISAKSINFGTSSKNAGFNVSGGMIPQLEQAKTLRLRSASQTITFGGDVDFRMTAPDSRLILDFSALSSTDGHAVTLGAGEIDLVNSGNAAKSVNAGNGTLAFDAANLELGAGEKSFSGFSAVTMSAQSGIAARGDGSLNAGAADLKFQSPLFLVGGGADQSVTTAGNLVFAGSDGRHSTDAAEIGGTFVATAASINLEDSAVLQARAGGVTLNATSGNLRLGANTQIAANGFAQTFFDTTRVAGGGFVRLIADTGNIDADSSSRIDISSPSGYPGYAGAVELSAANGDVLSGGGAFDMDVIASPVANDRGGRLVISTQSLGTDTLDVPAAFSDTVDIHIYRGDLQLSSDIKAANVTLTADGGTVVVSHTIDASGEGGGSISLFGKNGVVLTSGAELLATASNADKQGGEVIIGTQGSGVLDLAGGVIDVSNTASSANGGKVKLRAPLIGSNDVAINAVQTTIKGAVDVTVEAYRVFDTHNSAFNGVIDPIAQPDFYGSCNNVGVCSGTLIEFVQNFALSDTAKAKFGTISPDVLHLQPGIELVNDDPNVNHGDITVANAWNLGAGFAGYLVSGEDFAPKHAPVVPAGTVMTDAYGNLLPQYAGYKGDLVFAPGISQITSLDYRVGGSVTGEAGALTLRAVRDVVVNDSITDGFFNTRNTFDANYQKNLTDWLNTVYFFGGASTDFSNVGGYLIAGATYSAIAGAAPLAPYAADANGISPSFSAKDKTPISGADLFPLIKDANGPIVGADGKYRAVSSWSYRIVAGANASSANPLSVRPLAVFADAGASQMAGHGNVIIDGHRQYNVFNNNSFANVTYETPTIVRTGTGSIDIAAGRDFILADTKAPGVVYTAGRASVALADPGYRMQLIDDPLNPGSQIEIPVATNPEGFLNPQIIACDINNFCNPYGPSTEAAFPVGGGHLTLSAQQDILGFEHPMVGSPGNGGSYPNQQYFAPWLIAQGTALSSIDFGSFSPLSGYVSTGQLFTPSQTSWWINFGSFDQGLMSVGGNVRVVAGRDIQELSVSLPTTARVSGGLSSTIVDSHGNTVANIPVVHLNGSGDLTVIAGRDLKSGAYYEGSGDAEIVVGGSISASWSIREDPTDPGSATHAVSTILALDTGTISVTARETADIGGIVSGPSLQNVADPTGAFDVVSQAVFSYGPESAAHISSVLGDVIANSLSFGPALTYNIVQITNPPDTSAYPSINRYPANFEAVAMQGDVQIEDSLRLAASDNGNLDLLAYGSIYTFNTAASGGGSRPISTGPSLIEAVFDAANPLSGFAPPPGSLSFDLGSELLHQDDEIPDLFYAVTGDIVSGPGPSPGGAGKLPLAWEITKPSIVHAARDIVDLSYFGQNLESADVTSIVAGRDLYYTGAWQKLIGVNLGIPVLQTPENQGGLSLAGPGFFEIEAGRNLGPFVTAAADIAASLAGGPSDPIGTGIVTFGNTVTVGNRRMFSDQNPSAADPFALGANYRLERRGADIVALFGTGNGVDYQAVVDKYIDPQTSTSPRSYLPALVTFLETLGYPAMSADDAWSAFQALPQDLQHIFVDQVFVSELHLPGDAEGCCFRQYSVGYDVIGTLFPSSLGYTDNNVNGDEKPARVVTGKLDLLHATIKTLQSATITVQTLDGAETNLSAGGNIMILGPGGDIDVGTTALEINPKLSNSSLGILTLDNGAISVFTDGSVLVNQSRILTVQGGDILMWSSNGDLDAGRGAKTSVDFKPLSVNFDPNDLQTINLNGLVSGAGIGTIQSTPDAPAASAVLIAPRGTVNAGDAGLRSSGNLDILALLVLNAANIAAVGSVSGVPEVGAVNLSSLESASSTSGQAAKVAADSVAAAASRGAQNKPQSVPSLITVEVLGFGDCDPERGTKCPAI